MRSYSCEPALPAYSPDTFLIIITKGKAVKSVRKQRQSHIKKGAETVFAGAGIVKQGNIICMSVLITEKGIYLQKLCQTHTCHDAVELFQSDKLLPLNAKIAAAAAFQQICQ